MALFYNQCPALVNMWCEFSLLRSPRPKQSCLFIVGGHIFVTAPLRDLFYLVVGWGAEQYQCDTNDNGPNPNTQCKFPFMYNGEVQRECVKTSTPAAQNLICTELFNWAKVCFTYTYSGAVRWSDNPPLYLPMQCTCNS